MTYCAPIPGQTRRLSAWPQPPEAVAADSRGNASGLDCGFHATQQGEHFTPDEPARRNVAARGFPRPSEGWRRAQSGLIRLNPTRSDRIRPLKGCAAQFTWAGWLGAVVAELPNEAKWAGLGLRPINSNATDGQTQSNLVKPKAGRRPGTERGVIGEQTEGLFGNSLCSVGAGVRRRVSGPRLCCAPPAYVGAYNFRTGSKAPALPVAEAFLP